MEGSPRRGPCHRELISDGPAYRAIAQWSKSFQSQCTIGLRIEFIEQRERSFGAIFPWYGWLAKGWLYGAAEFLNVQDYKNVQRWADALLKRPALTRGSMVNRTYGNPSSQLHERHDRADFDTKTQDKVAS